MIQLEFFEKDETVILSKDVKEIKKSTDKTRKALFAKHGDLEKKYNDVLSRLEILEKFICKGNNDTLPFMQMREQSNRNCS